MTNDELCKKIIEAIQELFGDTSVSAEETRRSLEALKDEIDIFLDALESDGD